MSQFPIADLTNAFIAFRDRLPAPDRWASSPAIRVDDFARQNHQLPADHERRVRLNGVSSLRYDTITLDVVHLIDPEHSDLNVRRLTGNTLEEVASNLVLFPKHYIISFIDDPEYTTMTLGMSRHRREKEGINDILRVDRPTDHSSTSLVLLVKRQDSDDDDTVYQQIERNLESYYLKKTNPEQYLISKTFNRIVENIGDSFKSGDLNEYRFTFSPIFLQKVNRLLKESPTLKTAFDIALTGLSEQIEQVASQSDFREKTKEFILPLLPSGVTIEQLGLNRITKGIFHDYLLNIMSILFPGNWTPQRQMLEEKSRSIKQISQPHLP